MIPSVHGHMKPYWLTSDGESIIDSDAQVERGTYDRSLSTWVKLSDEFVEKIALQYMREHGYEV